MNVDELYNHWKFHNPRCRKLAEGSHLANCKWIEYLRDNVFPHTVYFNADGEPRLTNAMIGMMRDREYYTPDMRMKPHRIVTRFYSDDDPWNVSRKYWRTIEATEYLRMLGLPETRWRLDLLYKQGIGDSRIINDAKQAGWGLPALPPGDGDERKAAKALSGRYSKPDDEAESGGGDDQDDADTASDSRDDGETSSGEHEGEHEHTSPADRELCADILRFVNMLPRNKQKVFRYAVKTAPVSSNGRALFIVAKGMTPE